jgi:mRNA-degrading endonuclease toxin of MazEF toxin-antitoxin module
MLTPNGCQGEKLPTHVELPAGEGSLKEISMAKCEQIDTTRKTAKNPYHIAGKIL